MATKKHEHKFNVETYPYPECREQHVWKHHQGAIDETKKLAYQIQQCTGCPTRRKRVISMRTRNYGDTLSTSYVYPQDYRIVGGIEPAERGQIRMYNFLGEMAKGSRS